MNQEKVIKPINGWLALSMTLLLVVFAALSIVFGAIRLESGENVLGIVFLVIGIILAIVAIILAIGIRIIRPNEALVLLLFGNYFGTLNKPGIHFVNPFARPFNPNISAATSTEELTLQSLSRARVSLKAEAYVNNQQKVHDSVGNPIEISVVLIWRVIDTYKACFDVSNYVEFISAQADAATRQVCGQFPFDSEKDDIKTLRGSSMEVSEMLKVDLQERVLVAGVEIIEVRIAHLAYAKEIAAVMLQRQQAQAVVAAKQKIAEGAVGIIETTINKLEENDIVKLTDEKRQEIVSNLLVILCSSKEAQPTVSIGSSD